MTTLCTCPTCGQALPMPRATVDALLTLPLGKNERRLIDVLAKAYPKPVEHWRLVHALYGDDPNGGPETADKIISVYMCRLRPKLRPLGWTIPDGTHHCGTRADRRLLPLEA